MLKHIRFRECNVLEQHILSRTDAYILCSTQLTSHVTFDAYWNSLAQSLLLRENVVHFYPVTPFSHV
jgi:hypothetical protein